MIINGVLFWLRYYHLSNAISIALAYALAYVIKMSQSDSEDMQKNEDG